MAIQDVVNAVTARLGSTPVIIGMKQLAADAVPPRVVFVPTRDKFGPAERTNGTTVARVDGSGNKTWAGRQLMVRYAGVQVHCWGADIPSTETLVAQVLAAIHLGIAQDLDITQIAPKGYKLLDGGWLDQAWSNLGEVWVGNFEFAFPVLDQVNPTAVVTSIPETPELETPVNPPTEENGG